MRLCLQVPSSLSWETRYIRLLCSPPLLGWAGRGRRGGFLVGFEGLPASVLHKGGSVNPAQLQSWREGCPGAQGPCGGLSADPGPVRSSGLSGGRAGPAYLSPQISHHLLSGTPCLNSPRVFLPQNN